MKKKIKDLTREDLHNISCPADDNSMVCLYYLISTFNLLKKRNLLIYHDDFFDSQIQEIGEIELEVEE